MARKCSKKKSKKLNFSIKDYNIKMSSKKTSPKSASDENMERKTDTRMKERIKRNPDIYDQTPTNNINICIVGCVSAGKSTILNALFRQDFAQAKIKRTTMVPTVFVEVPDSDNSDNSLILSIDNSIK